MKKSRDGSTKFLCARAARIVLINLGVLCGFACVLLLGLEFVLRTTNWLDQANSSTPSYIPPSFKQIDQEIDRSGLRDIWGFRSEDGADQLEKLRNSNNEKCRVVILGDSYIQGDGLRVGQRWPDQYQQMTKCDVFAFGNNGWTTVEMLAFYEGRLRHLDFDQLVISFVPNDPYPRLALPRSFLNLSHSRFERYTLPEQNYNRLSLGLLGVSSRYACEKETGSCWWLTRVSKALEIFEFLTKYSRALDYLDQRISKLGHHFPGSTTQDKNGNLVIMEWGYTNWLDRLYHQDVLSMWQGAITDFSGFSRHPFLFLITSDNPENKAKIDKVAETFVEAGISYVDCAIYNEKIYISGIRPRRFWANLADGHPGTEQSQGFAQCLYSNLDLGRVRFTPVHIQMLDTP